MELLDAEKFSHIATSEHFLLSELYLPDDTDPDMPAFSGGGGGGGGKGGGGRTVVGGLFSILCGGADPLPA